MDAFDDNVNDFHLFLCHTDELHLTVVISSKVGVAHKDQWLRLLTCKQSSGCGKVLQSIIFTCILEREG